MSPIQLKSWSREKIGKKIVISFCLMSLIPLLLVLYLIYAVAPEVLLPYKDTIDILIVWMIMSAGAGYFVVRSLYVSLKEISKGVRQVAVGGMDIALTYDSDDEVGDIIRYFKEITRKLQMNLAELKESKRVLQDVIQKISVVISSSSKDIKHLLFPIIQTITGAVGAASGILLLYDESKEELHLEAFSGRAALRAESKIVKSGEGSAGWVAKNRKPLLINDIRNKNILPGDIEAEGVKKNLLCIPLSKGEKLLGVVCVRDKKLDKDFTEEDMRLLDSLATQTAVAIENFKLSEDIEQTYIETISALVTAIEARDVYTQGHSRRVGEYSVRVAKRMGVPEEEIEVLRSAGMLHDIGKIGIDDGILKKEGALTGEEYDIVKKHVIIGENIMRPIHKLHRFCDLVRHHQEWVNGKGYPDGLKGEDMSLVLKIIIVADSFDAMTSDRSYRRALSLEDAKAELIKFKGSHFDAEVTQEFIKMIDEKGIIKDAPRKKSS